MAATVRMGTSGWYYKHWRGRFYGDELAPIDMLPFYAGQFDTVEINNTFYALPSLETAQKWREKTPPGFVFAIKASRFLTHLKRLLDTGEGLRKFFEIIESLGEKAGPILFQLPPRWRANADRLSNFISALPTNYRYAFEFRDPSWFSPVIYDILRNRNIALCITNRKDEDSPAELTADFTYIRFHGGAPSTHGKYESATLSRWASTIDDWRSRLDAIYVYFNNDWEGFAIENATELRGLVEKQPSHA
jgi:uncharacterized protein YecE (DUF72 family)